MAKYRKKPVVIEAEQFHVSADPSTHPVGVVAVLVRSDDPGVVLGPYGPETQIPRGANVAFGIRTPEGWHVVQHGDWIITGVKGERYPCKPDIFAATYELVEGAGA